MNNEIRLTKNEKTVLGAIYAFYERGEDPDDNALVQMTGLSNDEVAAATSSLHQLGLIAPATALVAHGAFGDKFLRGICMVNNTEDNLTRPRPAQDRCRPPRASGQVALR